MTVAGIIWLLMAAPCSTDYCVEVEAETLYSFTAKDNCDTATYAIMNDREGNLAWCEPVAQEE